MSVDNHALVKLLVEDYKANCNAVDSAGMTPLHWSALVNAVESAKLLVQASAEINKQCKKGNTPLHLAAGKGNNEFVQYLNQLPEIDSKVTNNDGVTAYEVSKKLYKTTRKTGQIHKMNMKILQPPSRSWCCMPTGSCFSSCFDICGAIR